MMSDEEFERLFRKCYNPSITDFEKENGESWNDICPDFAERCNYIGEEEGSERSPGKHLSPSASIGDAMPFESCPNCGAEIVPFNGESPKFCMHCGFRLASGDASCAEPRGSGNTLYDRILAAISSGTVIDHRTEPYDRETAIDAFNRMARLDHIRSREQMSAHFSNACAVAAMVIANDPDPYLVNGMMGSLEAMEAKLVSERGMWQGPGPTAGKNQGIKSIGRNVSSLHAKLKGRSVAEDRAASDATRARLTGDPAWRSAAEGAADALMDTSEADEKSSLLFGKNVVCKGAKVFEEYVRVLCG